MAAPTKDEMDLIAKFRLRLADLELTAEQNADMFLIKWIRAREGKLDQSEQMLRKSLIWRKEYGTDSILKWCPPELVNELLFMDHTGYDKAGNPVLIMPFGRYDFRQILQAGYREDAIRMISQLWEILMDNMKGRVTQDGVPMTQMTVIVDVDKLGMKTVGSLAIVDCLKEVVNIFEANYPEILKKAYIINASRIFQILFAILKPLLSPRTFGKIGIYTNSNKWMPVLQEDIPLENFPEFYGGLGESKLHRHFGYTMKKRGNGDSFEEVTVAAGDLLKIPIRVCKDDKVLKWNFQTEYYDIEFSLSTSDGKEVLAKRRVECFKEPEIGEYPCKGKSGTYVFTFDNSYSRMRAKSLKYSFNVL